MRAILLLFLSYQILNACALCSLYTPTATADIEINTGENRIKTITITWDFGEEFYNELLRSYDNNSNSKIDTEEQNIIAELFFDYVGDKDYLTKIKYYSSNTNLKSPSNLYLPIKLRDKKFYFTDDGKPEFTYTIVVDKPLQEKMVLYIHLQDIGGYFDFLIHNVDIETQPPWSFETNVNANVLFASINNKLDMFKTPTLSSIEEEEEVMIVSHLKEWLSRISEQIEYHLKRNNPSSWLWLIGFSFIYGLIHASGPGHGKLLVGSYFTASKRSYKNAASISLLIGIIHTFSAFLMTLVVYLFLDLFFKSFVEDVSFYLTKISAVIIITIALYLLYGRYASKKGGESHCGCGSCSADKKSDLSLAISAGIVPCPGTITIFILALSLGEYILGFLAAIFMSFGMSIVIFIAGTAGVGLSKISNNHFTSIVSYMNIVAIFIILLLGVLLLVI